MRADSDLENNASVAKAEPVFYILIKPEPCQRQSTGKAVGDQVRHILVHQSQASADQHQTSYSRAGGGLEMSTLPE